MLNKTLSFEQTQGTKTFYLPFQTTPEYGPELALMFRRKEDGSYEAGMAACSLQDSFVKRIGRRIAFHRLNNRPFEGSSAQEIMGKIIQHVEKLAARRHHIFSVLTYQDLTTLEGQLDETFHKLDKNRRNMEVNDDVGPLYFEEGGGC